MRCAMRCDQCRFYSHRRQECRYASPLVGGGMPEGRFPRMLGGEWCGRHEDDSELASALRSLRFTTSNEFIAEHGADLAEKAAAKALAAVEARKAR